MSVIIAIASEENDQNTGLMQAQQSNRYKMLAALYLKKWCSFTCVDTAMNSLKISRF